VSNRIDLVLPLPPTDNSRQGVFRGHKIDSVDYRAYKKEVAAILLQKGFRRSKPRLRLSWDNPAFLTITLYLVKKSKRDWSNHTKVICDVLTQNGVWNDDQYVCVSYVVPKEVSTKEEQKVSILVFQAKYEAVE